MKICSICEVSIIDGREIIQKDNKYVCIGCNDIFYFLLDLGKPSKKKTDTPEPLTTPKPPIQNQCPCGQTYLITETCCNSCHKPNPLLIRKNKKKRKKY